MFVLAINFLKSIVFMVCKHEYMDICNCQFCHMSAIDPSDRSTLRTLVKASIMVTKGGGGEIQ